jgi:hypothetical protein
MKSFMQTTVKLTYNFQLTRYFKLEKVILENAYFETEHTRLYAKWTYIR